MYSLTPSVQSLRKANISPQTRCEKCDHDENFINNLRYADDTVVFADSLETIQDFNENFVSNE